MRSFQLLGHRGARGLFSENTVAGFAAAFALGVDAVELDVAMTADGVPVVSHEPALRPEITRGPDGHWLETPGPLLHALRFAELRRFDVGGIRPGSSYAAEFPVQAPQDGAHIPSFEEAVSIAPGRFLAELKTFPDRPEITAPAVALAEATVAVSDRIGTGSRLAIESFDWRGLRHLRRTRPDIALAWLTRAETVAASRLWWDGPSPEDFAGSIPRAVAAEGGPTWAPDYADLTRELIEEAHALGLAVIAWTVNRPADIARLIDWQIDGLITDRPDLAQAVMRGKGLALPPPLAVTPRPAR